MSRIALPVAVGALLGWAASHALFLGWWTLVPWGAAGLGLGYWIGKPGAMLAGALYGFTLAFVFMLAGYTGQAAIVRRIPFFALLGLFGAVCGLVLAAVGARLRSVARDSA